MQHQEEKDELGAMFQIQDHARPLRISRTRRTSTLEALTSLRSSTTSGSKRSSDSSGHGCLESLGPNSDSVENKNGPSEQQFEEASSSSIHPGMNHRASLNVPRGSFQDKRRSSVLMNPKLFEHLSHPDDSSPPSSDSEHIVSADVSTESSAAPAVERDGNESDDINLEQLAKERLQENIQQKENMQKSSKETTASSEESNDPNSLPNRLVDYFLIFGLETCRFTSLIEELTNIEAEGKESGLRRQSKRQVDSLVKATNHELQNTRSGVAHVFDRFPRQDLANFPIDRNWAAFAFPDGGLVSTRRRNPSCYYAVITQADGVQLFATYLRFDQPLVVRSSQSSKSLTTPSSRDWYRTPVFVSKTLCLISHYPCFPTFKECLTQLYLLGLQGSTSSSGISLERTVFQLCCEVPMPIPGLSQVVFTMNGADIKCRLPATRRPMHSMFSLENLFGCLGVDNVMMILTAMLCEYRIMFVCSSRSLLTMTMQCMLQLMYPFQWWYAYIPCLADNMLDAHYIPQPYMLGIESSHLSSLSDLSEVVVVDIDHSCVRSADPITPLPRKEGRDLWLRWREIVQRTVSNQDFLNVSATSGSSSPLFSPSICPEATDDSPNRTDMAPKKGKETKGLSGNDANDEIETNPKSQTHSRVSLLANDSDDEDNGEFDFDTEILRAVLNCYADIMCGYRKFLFWIQNVPFFNGAGFLNFKTQKSPEDVNFFTKLLASRAFDVYIEEELEPDQYHEYMSAGLGSNRLDKILELERNPIELCRLEPPPPDIQIPLQITSDGSIANANLPFCVPMRQELFDGANQSSFRRRKSLVEKQKHLFGRRSTRSVNTSNTLKDKNSPAARTEAYLSKIFSSSHDSLSSENSKEIQTLLEDQTARDAVCKALCQPKVQGAVSLCLSKESFGALGDVINSMLHWSMKQKDFATGTSVRDSSNIFFMEDDDGSKIYIEAKLKDHVFWQDIEYWKSALSEAVSKQFGPFSISYSSGSVSSQSSSENAASHDGNLNTDTDKKQSLDDPDSPNPEASEEVQQEFVLQWMISAISQMLSYGLDAHVVSECMEELCNKFQLRESYTVTVKEFMKKMSVAMDMWNSAEGY